MAGSVNAPDREPHRMPAPRWPFPGHGAAFLRCAAEPGSTKRWIPDQQLLPLFRRCAREHRLGSVDTLVPLAFGGVVIDAGGIGYGAGEGAIRSAGRARGV